MVFTAGAIVTVTVSLHRRPLGDKFEEIGQDMPLKQAAENTDEVQVRNCLIVRCDIGICSFEK